MRRKRKPHHEIFYSKGFVIKEIERTGKKARVLQSWEFPTEKYAKRRFDFSVFKKKMKPKKTPIKPYWFK